MTRDRFDALERFTPLFEPPDRSFEGFLRRRDRHRRNERVAAGAVGLAVFAAMVWAVASGGIQRTTRPPETEPTIAPEYPGAVGLQGLPPEGATPSSPIRGELVLDFMFGHTMGDPGRFGLSLYEDGRLIWHRLGDGVHRGLDPTGLVEQRLTPEGVDLVISEVLSTGLFDDDLHLTNGQGLYFGDVTVRNGARMVQVTWGDVGLDFADQTAPTAEQARALVRLDSRLLNPAAWLPASAWEHRRLGPYVPSRFSVCVDTDRDIGLDGVLASLPQPAEDLLRAWDRTYEPLRGGADSPAGYDIWCSRVTTDQARVLADILDDAGSQRIDWDPELGYEFDGRGSLATVTLWIDPMLPHHS